jgi:hypothetical protein
MKLPTRYSKLSPAQKLKCREDYYSLQEGKCYHCKEPLDEPPAQHIMAKHINWKLFPPNFLEYPHHLHHDHDTDMTIGVVHARCNAVLWQYHNE